MWIYKRKSNFIYQIHPLAMVVYVWSIIVMSICFTDPILLFGCFIATAIVLIVSDNLKEWLIYMKWTSYMIGMIVFLNVIVVNAGATVLLSGPVLPVVGKFKITLEALFYALGMGIRLMLMTSAFCLYNYTVDPDKALKLFSRLGAKSILMITLSTRLFPLLLSDYRRISEVQLTRGANLKSGSIKMKIKNTLPIVSALLLSSLERAFKWQNQCKQELWDWEKILS